MLIDTPFMGHLAVDSLEKRLASLERLNYELMAQLAERVCCEEMINRGWQGERLLTQLLTGALKGLGRNEWLPWAMNHLNDFYQPGFVYFGSVRNGEMSVTASTGRESVAALKSPLPLAVAPVYLSTLRSGNAMVVHDVEAEVELASLTSHFLARGIAALLESPVFVEGQLVGVVGVASNEPTFWSEPEQRLLSQVAVLLSGMR